MVDVLLFQLWLLRYCFSYVDATLLFQLWLLPYCFSEVAALLFQLWLLRYCFSYGCCVIVSVIVALLFQ